MKRKVEKKKSPRLLTSLKADDADRQTILSQLYHLLKLNRHYANDIFILFVLLVAAFI